MTKLTNEQKYALKTYQKAINLLKDELIDTIPDKREILSRNYECARQALIDTGYPLILNEEREKKYTEGLPNLFVHPQITFRAGRLLTNAEILSLSKQKSR